MFKKIVAYLASSPAMLWQLGRLDQKHRREFKMTKKLLCLIILNLIFWAILYLGNTSNSLSTETVTIASAEDAVYQININDKQPIGPSQAIHFELSLTNTQETNYSNEISIDFSKLERYLSLITPESENITKQNKQLVWKIDNLEPNTTTTQIIKFQSLNNFGYLINDHYDNCSQNVAFGNEVKLSFSCHWLKDNQIKIINFINNNSHKLTLIFGIILATLLVIKSYYLLELKTKIKIAKLVRRQINQGRIHNETK